MLELLMLTGTDLGVKPEEAWELARKIIEPVVYILMGILIIILIIKGITTAMAVVKAADDVQLRQEKLSSFKYLAIGLGVGIVILLVLSFSLNYIGDFIVGKLKSGS